MAKTIITIGREYYCTGGRFIAEDVAQAGCRCTTKS